MLHNQPFSSINTIILILLRISLMLVATLATLLLTVSCMDALPFGKAWVCLVAISGCLFIGVEFITLFRELAIPARPSLNKASRLTSG